MGGNPSGRSQTLVLAAWLQEQLSACSSHLSSSLGIQSCKTMQHNRGAVTAVQPSDSKPMSKDPTEAANAAADESSMSQSVLGEVKGAAEPAAIDDTAESSDGISHQAQGNAKHAAMAQGHTLASPRSPRAAWCSPRGRASKAATSSALRSMCHAGLTNAPHLPNSASKLSLGNWQGLLPEEYQDVGLSGWAQGIIRDYPGKGKTVLGLLGSAFGVLVHQVAMHCFERGALMAGVWNMYTALMDAEVQLLEDNVQVDSASDNSTSKEQYETGSCSAW